MKNSLSPAGNYYDKYNTANPIAKIMLNNFKRELIRLCRQVNFDNIYEAGCGEGNLAFYLHEFFRKPVSASDFSNAITIEAQARYKDTGIDFSTHSIYDLDNSIVSGDLFICCEVLEHLEYPEKALETVSRLNSEYFVFSVPNEPIWRILNLARGKYILSAGNTPGHIQHWNHNSFCTLVNKFFEIIENRRPFPWIMLLCKKKTEK